MLVLRSSAAVAFLLSAALPAIAFDAATRARLPISTSNSVDTGSVDVAGDDAGKAVNVQPSNGGWWTKDQIAPTIPAGRVVRLNDRIIIGRNANTWDGGFKSKGADFPWTMGRGIYGYLVRDAQVVVSNPVGSMAAVFASSTGGAVRQPSYNGVSCCAMSVAVLGLNDNTTVKQPYWLYYGTGVRLPGTGDLTSEIDVMNATSELVRATSYGTNPTGTTIAMSLQSGGEGAPYNNACNQGQPVATGQVSPCPPFPLSSPSTAALQIQSNGTFFDKGIVFKDQSLTPTTDGAVAAINLPKGYNLRWTFDASDVTGTFITSYVTKAANQIGLQFDDFGAHIQNLTASLRLLDVDMIGGAVNRPYVQASAAGSPVIIGARGTDTVVDLALRGQGGGRVDLQGGVRMPIFGPASSSAPCRAGEFSFDANFAYACIATNTWKRAALTAY